MFRLFVVCFEYMCGMQQRCVQCVMNEMSMAQFEMYCGSWLEGVRRATENFSLYSLCAGKVSTWLSLPSDWIIGYLS
jgi:hypothetical protein